MLFSWKVMASRRNLPPVAPPPKKGKANQKAAATQSAPIHNPPIVNMMPPNSAQHGCEFCFVYYFDSFYKFFQKLHVLFATLSNLFCTFVVCITMYILELRCYFIHVWRVASD